MESMMHHWIDNNVIWRALERFCVAASPKEAMSESVHLVHCSLVQKIGPDDLQRESGSESQGIRLIYYFATVVNVGEDVRKSFDKTGKTPLETAMLYLEGAMQCKFGDSEEQQKNFMEILTEIRRETAVQAILVASRNNGTTKAREIFDQYKEYLSKSEVESVKHMLLGMNCFRDFLSFKDYFKQVQQFVSRMLSIVSKPVINRVALTIYKRRDQCKSIYQELVQFSSADSDSEEADVDIEAVSEFGSQESDSDGREMEKEGFLGFHDNGEKKRTGNANVSVCSSASNRLSRGEDAATTSKQQTTVNERPLSASRQDGPNSPLSTSSKQDSFTFKKIHPRQLRSTQTSSATSNEQIPSAKDLRIGRGSRPPSVTSTESGTSAHRRRGARRDNDPKSSVGDIDSRQSSKTKAPAPPPPSNDRPGSSDNPFVVPAPAQRPPNTRHTNRPPSSRASSVRSSAGWSCMSGKCSHQKHPFTDLQDSYIIMGVEKFGFGSWKKIRCEYPFPEYRTPVHLKDRWRTMSGHGKVTIGQNGEIHLKGIYKTLVPHVRENRFKELDDSGTLVSDRQTRRVRRRGKNTNERATNGNVSTNRSPVISSDAESTADMRGFEAIERWTRSAQDQASSEQPRRQIPPLFSGNRETTQRTKSVSSDANEHPRNDGGPNLPTPSSVSNTTGDYIQSTSKSPPHDIRPTSSNHLRGAAGDATPSDDRKQHGASAGVEMREIPIVSSLENNAALRPDTVGPDSSRPSKNDKAGNAGTSQVDEPMQGDFAGSEMSRNCDFDNAESNSAKRPNPSDQPEPKSESAGSEMSSSFISPAQRKQPHDATQRRSSPRPQSVELNEINRSCDKSTDIVNRSSPTLSIPPAFDSPMPYTFETDESEDEDVSLKTSATAELPAAQKICASIDLTGDEISENESEGEQADGGVDHPMPNPEMQKLTEKMLSEPNEVTPDEDTIDLTGSPKQVRDEHSVDGGTNSLSPSSVYYSATDGDTHSMGSVSSPEFTLAERMKDLETDQSAAEDDTMNESVIPNRTLTEEHSLNASVVLGAESNGQALSLENVIELDAPASVPHGSTRNTQSSGGNTGTVYDNVERDVEQDPSSVPSSSTSGMQSFEGNTGHIPDNVEQYMQEHPASVPSSFSSSTQLSDGNTLFGVDAGNSSASCNVHEMSSNETGISVPSSSSSNEPVGNTEGSTSTKNSAQSQDGDQEQSSSVAHTSNKEAKDQGLPSDASGSQSPRSTGFESGSVPNEQGCSEAIEIGRRHVGNTATTSQDSNSGNTPSTDSPAAQPLDRTQNSDNSETSRPTGNAQEVSSSGNPGMGTADLPDSQSRPFGRRTFKVTAKRSRNDPPAKLPVKTEPVDVGGTPWTTQGIVPSDSTSTTTDTTAKQSVSSARCDLQKNSQFMRNKLKTKQKNDATHETVIKIDSDSNDDSQKGSPSPPVTRNKLKNIVNQVETEVTSTPNTSGSNARQTRSSSLAPNSQADSKGKKFLKELPRLRRRKRKIIDLDQVGVPMKVSKEVEEQFRTNLVKAAEAKSVFETAGERKGTSRKTWTAEEDENLRNGVERYGKGQWTKISESYTFRNRTTVNLKDRYRVLEEKGTG